MYSSQNQFNSDVKQPALSREARLSWIGSKLAQSVCTDESRLDELHHRLWMRILQDGLAPVPPRDETDQLAVDILAVAMLVEQVSATGGAEAALAAVKLASGQGLDPALADHFLRLGSALVFWAALDLDRNSEH
ncbi:MAG: hypothetical protein V4657_00290 [Pseudomonadota bacterium]